MIAQPVEDAVRDEACGRRRRVHRSADVVRGEVPARRQVAHPRVCAQDGGELVVPDVDRVDVLGAPFEEDLGEPAGAGSDVGRSASPHPGAAAGQVIEGAEQLAGSPRDPVRVQDGSAVRVGRDVEADVVSRGHGEGGLVRDVTADADNAEVDEVTGVAAAAGQAPGDELHVEAGHSPRLARRP